MRSAALFAAFSAFLTSSARAQVRHAWSVAPSVQLGLSSPSARHALALRGAAASGGSRRRLADRESVGAAERGAHAFGEAIPLVGVTPESAGEWQRLHDGSRLWRLVLSCPGAESLHVFADAFQLAPGDRLYVHNGGDVGTRGAYTEANNAHHRTFASPPMPGDELHLELHETPRGAASGAGEARRLLNFTILVAGTTPAFGADAWRRATGRELRRARPAGPPSFGAGQGAPVARPAGGGLEKLDEKVDAPVRLTSWISGSGSCMVNERCEVGKRWAAQSAGVAAIVEHRTASICTGTLVNSLGSEKPRQFFLTAFHCVRSRVEAADFDPSDNFLAWSFLFNWQSERCATDELSSARQHAGGIDSVYGATIRAYGNDTDFALLEIHEPIPASFGVNYVGWDSTGKQPNMSLIIHHPTSDLKKVTVDYDAPHTKPFGGDGYFQLIFGERRVWSSPHWFVDRYEIGSTEGGSSGGPLFDWYGRLIGVLHGGYADCRSPQSDWYGKLLHQWEPAADWFQAATHGALGPWLDPQRTGVRVTDGEWLRPHAHAAHELAAVQMSSTALAFANAAHAERAVSASLLTPPLAAVRASLSVEGDEHGCFLLEPSALEWSPASWEEVRWVTVKYAAGASPACARVLAQLSVRVASADEAYARAGEASAVSVQLYGPLADTPLGVASPLSELTEVQPTDAKGGFFLVGCYATLPAEHRREVQTGAMGGASACHAPCVSDGFDFFMLGSGACYCVSAAVVDRDVPADALPSRACHGSGVRTYSLYRSLSLGKVGAPESLRAAGPIAADRPVAERRRPAAALALAAAAAALAVAWVRARRASGSGARALSARMPPTELL